MELILASASPRRKELLSLITNDFIVCPADVDESLKEENTPENEVMRLSLMKAQKAYENYPNAVCIGSDTLVTLQGEILGKPKNAADAKRMLSLLCGKTHEVLTGLAVCLPDGSQQTLCTKTSVQFRMFDDTEIDAYVKTGEPLDKAGAYGIQGYGALLVDRIDGDYYSVMGLPVAKLFVILRQIGAV